MIRMRKRWKKLKWQANELEEDAAEEFTNLKNLDYMIYTHHLIHSMYFDMINSNIIMKLIEIACVYGVSLITV